ncbi:F-box/WD repeat-containing protein 9 [Aulostomus maculatus]
MSEERVELKEEGTGGEKAGLSLDQVKKEASKPDLEGLVPGASLAGISPSPSPEASGLLSLPWEMVTHIASHLPAHCVINVLPKVCCALRNVDKDRTAWQVRARRLVGPRATFPVGPKEDFDWSTACLEMEQLITSWTGQVHLLDRQTQVDEEERERGRERRREPVADQQEDGADDVIDEGGVAVQEVANGADGRMGVVLEGEDGDLQPAEGGDQLARLREELEERRDDNAEALLGGERDHRVVYDDDDDDAHQDLNRQEDFANPRLQGDGRNVVVQQCQPPRSPSPPPAMECTTLPSSHIAQVNTVLLVGDGGKICATGSRDWNVKLWDLQADCASMLLHTLGAQGHFSTHLGWVWCLASEGPLLASGGFDSTVRLWDLQACGAERGLIRAGAAVLCLSFQRDVLLAGTFDKRVSMYDTRAAEPLVKSLRHHGNAVMCLAADDKYIISGSQDCTVAVYDRRADKGFSKLRLSSYLLSMSYSDSEIWGGDNKGMLHSFSMRAGVFKSLSEFDVGHTALVTGIHRSPGCLYTCSSDRTVKVHIPCGPPKTLCTLRHQGGVSGLSVNAGVLAVASGDTCVEIWRPRK